MRRVWQSLAGLVRLAACLALVMLVSPLQTARANDWMFRRSYFSHQLPPGVAPNYPIPDSRSAYRTAYYHHGFGVNSSYRINNYVIQNGSRIDRTIYQEGWLEFTPPAD